MKTEIRNLRLAVLERQKKIGELLITAANMVCEQNLLAVIDKHAIAPDDAMACIVLHMRWQDFKIAEQWHHECGYHTPISAKHAIYVIQQWQQFGMS